MNSPVVVVDPFSSGTEVAPAFAAHGVPAVAVLSAPGLSAQPWRPGDFAEVLEHSPAAVHRLRELRPRCVLPGTESGVALAEELTRLLTPRFANEPSLAVARRNKGAMQAALAGAGLPAIRGVCTGDPAVVSRWLAGNGLDRGDLIVKPAESAGTDGVTLVPAGTPWRPAFDRLAGATNRLGRVNDDVVVQELLTGTEYAVDTVTVDGRHVLCGIGRYTKRTLGGSAAVYDCTDFIPMDPAVHGPMVAYTYAALDALGVRWGAAHSEVMMTAGGPRLIETGMRAHGGGHPEYSRLGTGSGQLERLAEAFAGPGPVTGDYVQHTRVRSVFLAAPRRGVLRDRESFTALRGLRSHYTTRIGYADGDVVPRTRDLYTIFGLVVLAHPDPDVIEADYRRVREAESALRLIDADPPHEEKP
ncbi:ATP-grasp domain-containing protein [Actinoplanes oblitus]|uniref:ATP-grasp domain-containing protein n=1 Tax=Actinoplanes oblitus TaxID=3040509 RepID=A0ABY8WPP4_9ACTN|nr:ATP-grasp domain-containing protein [Actinoplanes oblitus]WIM99851.1 ATP-grasp domain-containing protein [Actinoplanes oblitus]